MRKEIIKKAQEEYDELKKFVENYKGTFDELYNELEDTFNFNEDKHFFDVNYGKYINTTVLNTTYYFNDTEHFILSDMVTIWDAKDGTVFPESEDFVVCHRCGKLVPDCGKNYKFTDDDKPVCNKCANKIKQEV